CALRFFIGMIGAKAMNRSWCGRPLAICAEGARSRPTAWPVYERRVFSSIASPGAGEDPGCADDQRSFIIFNGQWSFRAQLREVRKAAYDGYGRRRCAAASK